MARKPREKKFRPKHMQQHEVDELMSMDEIELNKEFVKAKKNERAAKKQIKDNDELKKLKEAFTLAKGNHPNTQKMLKLKEQIKDLNKEMLADKEVEGAHLDYKAYKEGFDNTTKGFTERQKAILFILNQREFNS